MKKSEQDKTHFDFTEQWMSCNLPGDMTITTEKLYEDFTDRLNSLEVDKADMPSRSAFLSRLHKMKFLVSTKVYERSRKSILKDKDKKVWQTAWKKIEVVKDAPVTVEPDKTCRFSKLYVKAMKLYARGKERLTWVK